MGGSTLPGLKHVSTSRLIEAATSVGGMQTSALSLRPRSESCFRQHVRSSMSVQVAAGEDVCVHAINRVLPLLHDQLRLLRLPLLH